MAQEQLRILIVGNGGREHAFAWKLSESPLVDVVYVAPGNGGTGLDASGKITNANVKGDDYPGLVAFAQQNKVNLVVPGPEAPLVDGIQGYFQAGGFMTSDLECNVLRIANRRLNSRYPLFRSIQGRRPYGRLQDLLEGLHATPSDPHC